MICPGIKYGIWFFNFFLCLIESIWYPRDYRFLENHIPTSGATEKYIAVPVTEKLVFLLPEQSGCPRIIHTTIFIDVCTIYICIRL